MIFNRCLECLAAQYSSCYRYKGCAKEFASLFLLHLKYNGIFQVIVFAVGKFLTDCMRLRFET